jgi:xylan 1,4-beta-xylosidase
MKRSHTVGNWRRTAWRRVNKLALCGLVLVGSGKFCASAFTLLSSNQLVFVNVDHAPVGACSTITYGLNGPSGPYYNIRGDWCGLGMSSPGIPYYDFRTGGGGGVLIALSNSAGLHTMPFLASPASAASNATFFADTNTHRRLTPGTDEWSIDGAGLSFVHYSPAWRMDRLDTATLAEKRRFFLPATWITLTLNNTNATPADLYFGLPAAATQKSFANGAYQGFAVGEAAFAVPTGACDLLTGASLTAVLNGVTQGFAFHINVPAGQSRSLTAVIAYYRSAVVDSRIPAVYYYTTLFPSIDSVIDAAFTGFGDAQMRCGQLTAAMAAAGLNPFRQFLASHAMHSYMADTTCLVDPGGGVHWRVPEGAYYWINTFDLTVDLAFYEAQMYPWALRNVLDTYSGAIPGRGYSFDHPLYSPSGTMVSSTGFSFHHDMGTWPTSQAPGTDPVFDDYMGQEQLQNWILSAGLYWSHTADHQWLTNNTALLQRCLNSMLLRDDTNSLARDGITQNINSPELTTFDDIDASLRSAPFSGRLAVRNWACYLALQAMFRQIGDQPDATTCSNMAATAVQTIVDRWNTYQGTLGYIPALLNGSDQSAIIPMIEGLAYPAQMGLSNAIDRANGPYAPMLQALSNHLVAVLVPGRCLDATSGAWKMTTSTYKTWQSKMYLAQYVAEHVLGISGDTVTGIVDQIHATIQIQNAPFHEWSDETDSTGADRSLGGCHYPRGITSALWWLNAANNPNNPLPAAGTNIAAVVSGGNLTISWPSNYVGWILQTNIAGLENSLFWGDVPGSSGNSEMTFPMTNAAIRAQFFRLRRP